MQKHRNSQGDKVWEKNERIARNHDLPATIYYESGRCIGFYWFRHNLYFRTKSLPVRIELNGEKRWQQRHGEDFFYDVEEISKEGVIYHFEEI